MSSFNWPPLYEPYPDPEPPPPPRRPKSLWLRRLLFWGIPSAILVATIVVFFGVGRWLVVEDPLEPAHAIVVLSGRLPERAMEAAQLYRQNYSAQVWVSQPGSPAEELAKLNIYYVGEEFYNQKVLLAEGVPTDAIRVLEKPAANTEQEIEEIVADLRRDGADHVIIVTSKAHTRRVRAIWNRKAGGDMKLIVRYPDDDPFDGAHWWRHTEDALDVLREVLGLLNAWTGFPVRHG